MVKHVTRRSYKKRASKKRRTIRKLITTLRRNIQTGGNGSLGLVAPLVVVLLILFGSNPALKGFFEFLQVLIGGPQNGGNKRLNQMGGGKLSEALAKFGDEIRKDTTIPPEKQNEVLKCIEILNDKGGLPDTVITEMNKPGNEDGAVKDIQNIQIGGMPIGMPSWLSNAADKVTAAAATTVDKVKAAAATTTAAAKGSVADIKAQAPPLSFGVIGNKIANATNNATSTVSASFTAARTSFMTNITPKINKAKDFIIRKASYMTNDEKRRCMGTILSYGFDLAKVKLTTVTTDDIQKAMEKIRQQSVAKGKELISSASSTVTGMTRNLFNNSTPQITALEEKVTVLEQKVTALEQKTTPKINLLNTNFNKVLSALKMSSQTDDYNKSLDQFKTRLANQVKPIDPIPGVM